MRKLLFVLIALFFIIGCKTPASFHVINESDYDATISSNSDTYTIPKKTERYIDGDVYAPYRLNDNNHPIKLTHSGYLIVISNNFTLHTLNVKNTTQNEISFQITNNYDDCNFMISANTEKTFYIKTATPKIKTTHRYYSISENNDELNLCFY